jgi:hypothetical protein
MTLKPLSDAAIKESLEEVFLPLVSRADPQTPPS